MSLNHRRTVTHRLGQAAHAARVNAGAHLSEIGLHSGQEGLLKALAVQDGASMSELANLLGVKPPTVTKMVGRLSTQGYVERRTSEGDGRLAHVYLTDRGHQTIAKIDRVWKRLEKRALAGIDDKDRKRLRKLLRQVARNLNDAGNSDE